jgi:Flp pilus assembly protein TadG
MHSQMHFHPRQRAETGQALTEIALCLPILCVLLLSIVQYGVMIWHDMELTGAARDGARHAVVARVEPAPSQAVIDTVKSSFDTIDPDDVDVNVTGGWDRDDQVTVEVTTPSELDIAGLEVWSGDLRSTSTVRIG